MTRLERLVGRIIRNHLNEATGTNFVAYHGTDKKFTSFNDNEPIFFVDSVDVARTYGSNIIKASLTIKNPVVFDFSGGSSYYFNEKSYVPSKLAKYIKQLAEDIENQYSLDDDIMDELVAHEYDQFSDDLDGIIMENISDQGDGIFSTLRPATNYVVFKKTQIKVINN